MLKTALRTHSDLKLIPFIFSLALGAAIWLIPAPESVDNNGWHMLAIFVATICAIMTKALPMGAVSLFAVTVISLTETLPLKDALSGFANPIVWLVIMAFLVAKSFVKTGLGFRIAYHLVSLFGKKSLGLAYGMTFTDLILAPAIPSNSARGGGIVFPIIKSLALAFDSSPEQKTERRIGAFLIQTAYHANIVTGAMFLTAMAANPMMAEMAKELGIHLSWGLWALAAIVPGLMSLTLIPFVIYKLYPPEIKKTPQAKEMAQEKLKLMGVMSRNEKITLVVFLLMLCLWVLGGMYIVVFDQHFNIADVQLIRAESTTTAMIGVVLLILTGVLNWKDVTEEETAWNTFFWFSTLIMMAAALTKMGVIKWVSSLIEASVVDIQWPITYLLLVLGFFYSHYFFASSTAHASSMYVAFTVVGMSAGAPPLLMAFSLAIASNLSSCLTHYGTGPGPIFYGSGYVDLGTWWKLGGIIGILHLIIWIGIGSIWWKVIGLW